MAIKVANNQSLTAITALPSAVSGGAMTLLATETASSSATISFTSNIDSTYDEYVFKFYNIHPATDVRNFTFQVDTGTNTNYNQTITSTAFSSANAEADDYSNLGYNGSEDQAQGTAFQGLCESLGSDNDQSYCGELWLFNPSSTTFVKHFISTFQTYHWENISFSIYAAGYVNTTTALTRVQFKMASGDIDAGDICLYGIN